MDSLFKTRTLTTSINALRAPGRKIFQQCFASKLNYQPTDRLAFDIVSGNETVLSNIKIDAPASVGVKTGRRTITTIAPRLAEKRLIHTYEINAMRGYGEQSSVELMSKRIAREQLDMRNMFDRTLEFWAANALRGKIYDADLTTILVDYGLSGTHAPALLLTNRWTDSSSNPIANIRAWKLLIEEDSGHEITGWRAYAGNSVMGALLNHSKVTDLLAFERGRQIAEDGYIVKLAGVTIEEYNGSFLDSTGTRKRFVEDDEFILIGEGADVFDCPYAAVVDEDAHGGVGQGGTGQLFFSKSWKEEDPSGRWIKGESRPLPVLQRPDAIVVATAI